MVLLELAKSGTVVGTGYIFLLFHVSIKVAFSAGKVKLEEHQAGIERKSMEIRAGSLSCYDVFWPAVIIK